MSDPTPIPTTQAREDSEGGAPEQVPVAASPAPEQGPAAASSAQGSTAATAPPLEGPAPSDAGKRRLTTGQRLWALALVLLLGAALLHMHVTIQRAVMFVRLAAGGQGGPTAGAPMQGVVPTPPADGGRPTPPGGGQPTPPGSQPTPPGAHPTAPGGSGPQHVSAPGQAEPTPPPVEVKPPPRNASEEGGGESKGLGGVLAGIEGLLQEKPGSELLLTPGQTDKLIELLDNESADIVVEMGILGSTPQKVMAAMTDEQRAFVETHPPGNQKGFDPLGPKVIAMLTERAGAKVDELASPSPFPAIDNRNAIVYLEGLMTLEGSEHKLTREQARDILPYMDAMVKAHHHQKDLVKRVMAILTKEQQKYIVDLLEQVPNGQPPPNADAPSVLKDLQASQQH